MATAIINGTMFYVKIFYRNGKHKYANIFKNMDYLMGLHFGTIIGYRPMNRIEKFIFRNCL